MHGQIQGGGGAGGLDPPEKSGFSSNTDPDPLKSHKATKPAFDVGPSSACQGNLISMVFCWQADVPLMVVWIWILSPLIN